MIRRHNKTIKFNQLFDWYFQCLSICFTLVANCFESQQTLIHTSIVVQIVKRKEKYRRNIHLQRKCFWFFRSTSVKKILISARNFPDSKVSFRLLCFYILFTFYFISLKISLTWASNSNWTLRYRKIFTVNESFRFCDCSISGLRKNWKLKIICQSYDDSDNTFEWSSSAAADIQFYLFFQFKHGTMIQTHAQLVSRIAKANFYLFFFGRW